MALAEDEAEETKPRRAATFLLSRTPSRPRLIRIVNAMLETQAKRFRKEMDRERIKAITGLKLVAGIR